MFTTRNGKRIESKVLVSLLIKSTKY
uniref:Uncharacterized protein n=1 Tax=Arundo donax TaxID=35708 RepID=A0A0A8XV87_ARUDO